MVQKLSIIDYFSARSLERRRYFISSEQWTILQNIVLVCATNY